MGQVFYTGQVSRYVGNTELTVSDTLFAAASNINSMFAGEALTNASLIKYTLVHRNSCKDLRNLFLVVPI